MKIKLYTYLKSKRGRFAELANEISEYRKRHKKKPISFHAFYNRITATQARNGHFSATTMNELTYALSKIEGKEVTIELK